MRHISILSLLVLCAAIARAQITDSTSLPQIEFSRLSQRDPNPLGEKALAIHPEQWKHGETEHFIYHFVDSFVATLHGRSIASAKHEAFHVSERVVVGYSAISNGEVSPFGFAQGRLALH